MTSLLNYLWGRQAPVDKKDDLSFTVAVAESVTAGALTNILCSEPGASQYFKGGITAYSVASKKELLGIDTDYAELNNFANPFTTIEMAKAAAKLFKTRIGLATTGYSLPIQRKENKEKGECALDVKVPYAIICLYDSALDIHIIREVHFNEDTTTPRKLLRAEIQTKVSIEAKRMFNTYKKLKEQELIEKK